jgi:glycosyltransferase involved in cell wall biosynthesis
MNIWFVTAAQIRTEEKTEHLRATAVSILDQTDTQWVWCIVNDRSTVNLQANIPELDDPRIRLLSSSPNDISQNRGGIGASRARNYGAEYASKEGCQVVLQQDADDLAHPKRVERTRTLYHRHTNPSNLVLYSGFVAIDATGEPVPRAKIRPDMLEPLDQLRTRALEGDACFLPLTTMTGFLHTTSTVAMHIQAALRHPFPSIPGSEDSYCWMQLASDGYDFRFVEDIPCRYRFRGKDGFIEPRTKRFLQDKVDGDIRGFIDGWIRLYERKQVTGSELASNIRSFLARLSLYLTQNGVPDLASQTSSLSQFDRIYEAIAAGLAAENSLGRSLDLTSHPLSGNELGTHQLATPENR